MVIRDIDQERLSRLEGTYEQVDRRLYDMNSRLDGMQQAIDGLRAEMHRSTEGLRAEMHQSTEGLRAEMHSRFEELNNRYNALIIVLVASWVTIMGVLITSLFLK